MYPSPESLTASSAQSSLSKQPVPLSKPPQTVLGNIFAFPPNRDTAGGTAYLIVEKSLGNILVDCPAWNQVNQKFLQALGGVQWLFLSHRGGIGKAAEIQASFGCEILIQEQEAYLLQGTLAATHSTKASSMHVTTFQREFSLGALAQTIWTPGHSPGSSCLYSPAEGGLLFSGRHLLPNQLGEPVPLRSATTFHWPRQLSSVQLLLNRFSSETLQYICPGANTGFLRGKRVIDQAYHRLSTYAHPDENC